MVVVDGLEVELDPDNLISSDSDGDDWEPSSEQPAEKSTSHVKRRLSSSPWRRRSDVRLSDVPVEGEMLQLAGVKGDAGIARSNRINCLCCGNDFFPTAFVHHRLGKRSSSPWSLLKVSRTGQELLSLREQFFQVSASEMDVMDEEDDSEESDSDSSDEEEEVAAVVASERSGGRPKRQSSSDARQRIRNFAEQYNAVHELAQNDEKGLHEQNERVSTRTRKRKNNSPSEDTKPTGSDASSHSVVARNQKKEEEKLEGFFLAMGAVIPCYEPPYALLFKRNNNADVVIPLAVLHHAIKTRGGFLNVIESRQWGYVWKELDNRVFSTIRPLQAMIQSYIAYIHPIEIHAPNGFLQEFKLMQKDELEKYHKNSLFFVRGSARNHWELQQCKCCGIWERHPEVASDISLLCKLCYAILEYWCEVLPVDSRKRKELLRIKGEHSNLPLTITSCMRPLTSDECVARLKPKRRESHSPKRRRTETSSRTYRSRKLDERKTMKESSAQDDSSSSSAMFWTPLEVDNWMRKKLVSYGIHRSLENVFREHDIGGAALRVISISDMRQEMGMATGEAVIVNHLRNALFKEK